MSSFDKNYLRFFRVKALRFEYPEKYPSMLKCYAIGLEFAEQSCINFALKVHVKILEFKRISKSSSSSGRVIYSQLRDFSPWTQIFFDAPLTCFR